MSTAGHLKTALAVLALLVVGSCASDDPSSSDPAAESSIQFGTGRTDDAWALAIGGDGTMVIAGGTSGDLAGANSGQGDAFVRSMSPDGTLLWAKQFGTPDADELLGVAVGPDGSVTVAGVSFGDIETGMAGSGSSAFVRRYMADGTLVWTQQFGGPGAEAARALAVAPDGSIVVTGETNADLDGANRGGDDVYVRKYLADGSIAWTRQLGSAAKDSGSAIAVGADGSITVVGTTFGDLASTSRGGGDAFVARFDASGGDLWMEQFGTAGDDTAAGVVISGDGRITAVGGTGGDLVGDGAGENDVYARTYSPDGAVQWTRQVGSAGHEAARAVAASSDGTLVITGFTDGNLFADVAGGTDAWVLTLDASDGTDVATRQFGTTGEDDGRAVAVSGSTVVIAGMTTGDLYADGAGGADVFLRRDVAD